MHLKEGRTWLKIKRFIEFWHFQTQMQEFKLSLYHLIYYNLCLFWFQWRTKQTTRLKDQINYVLGLCNLDRSLI